MGLFGMMILIRMGRIRVSFGKIPGKWEFVEQTASTNLSTNDFALPEMKEKISSNAWYLSCTYI